MNLEGCWNARFAGTVSGRPLFRASSLHTLTSSDWERPVGSKAGRSGRPWRRRWRPSGKGWRVQRYCYPSNPISPAERLQTFKITQILATQNHTLSSAFLNFLTHTDPTIHLP